MTGFSAPLLLQPALTEEQESTHARVRLLRPVMTYEAPL